MSLFFNIGLGYDVDVTSLATHDLSTTKEFLFGLNGVHTSLPEEKHTVDCDK